jgi:LmbE family N-acetylglucosaminyl deacetylase
MWSRMAALQVDLLVVSPHPDDAEFGIAGTVATLTTNGKRVAYVIVTSGEKGVEDGSKDPGQIIHQREKEQVLAASQVGVDQVQFLKFSDGELEDNYRLRLAIAREIRRYRPRAVASTDPYRRYVWHRDHRITGQVVADAVYPFARNYPAFPELITEGFQPHSVSEMLFWGSDEANYYVDISSTIAAKLAALKCHRSQINQYGEENVERWVTERAAQQAEGQKFQFAEAFHRVQVMW